MLTWEGDVEVHALCKRGWAISAIARHTGRDRTPAGARALRGATDRSNAAIERPPREETNGTMSICRILLPHGLGRGSTSVGRIAGEIRALARGVLAPAMTQPHLVDGLDRICRRLGGLTRTWRSDRMATVCHPDT